ncbi:hypothetical protein ATCC90586_003009 [Pythium insidiosum]|nr:hypothetical protein ATCC90586_003009 [Pythium insidiosum]
MAPITLKKRDEPVARTSSRESAQRLASNNQAVASTAAKKKAPHEEPETAEKKTSLASRASSASSASSGSSARATATAAGTTSKTKDSKQATGTLAKRGVTPPTATADNNSNAKPSSSKTLPLPSQTLHKHKQAAVWTTGKKKHKTNFGSAYDAGSIPCRINHGSIKHSLHWTKDPQTLDFSPLLITCVEGFQETEHPFVFLARTMFRELLAVEDAREKTLVVLPQVIPPLRVALMSSDDDVFLMALEATRMLSDIVEEEMNTYLPKLTQQIHRKLLTKQLRAPVEETLAALERNGGKEALSIIRAKIPTYTSVH